MVTRALVNQQSSKVIVIGKTMVRVLMAVIMAGKLFGLSKKKKRQRKLYKTLPQ